mgnify:CR=1 FL=1
MSRTDTLILGLCLVVAAVLIAGGLCAMGHGNGRYQFARSNGVNVFVLDTRTGRLWSKFVEQTGGSTQWDEESGPWRKP